MKTWIAAVALGSLVGLAWSAPDELDDAYKSLKDAEAKKDAEGVKKWASETSKLARKLVSSPQSGDEAKQRVEFAKEVDVYTEYALSAASAQPGLDHSKAVELVDQLLAQNPKSKYLDARAMSVYTTALAALAEAASAKGPDRALTYANKLVNVMKARSRPEGVADADWERVKAFALGSGYYLAGAVNAQKQAWPECDRDLREALPYISKDPARAGPAYFYLGLCNYQFGRLTADRSRMQAAQRFSEQSAAIAGPMQQLAQRNAVSIRNELAAGGKR